MFSISTDQVKAMFKSSGTTTPTTEDKANNMPSDSDGASDNRPAADHEILHGNKGDDNLQHTKHVAPVPEVQKGSALSETNASGGSSAPTKGDAALPAEGDEIKKDLTTTINEKTGDTASPEPKEEDSLSRSTPSTEQQHEPTKANPKSGTDRESDDLEQISRKKAEKYVNLEEGEVNTASASTTNGNNDPREQPKAEAIGQDTTTNSSNEKDVKENTGSEEVENLHEEATVVSEKTEFDDTKSDTVHGTEREGNGHDLEQIIRHKAEKFVNLDNDDGDVEKGSGGSIKDTEKSGEATDKESSKAGADKGNLPSKEKDTVPNDDESATNTATTTESPPLSSTAAFTPSGDEAETTASKNERDALSGASPLDSCESCKASSSTKDHATHVSKSESEHDKGTSKSVGTDDKEGENKDKGQDGERDREHLHELELVSREKAEKFVNLDNDDGDVGGTAKGEKEGKSDNNEVQKDGQSHVPEISLSETKSKDEDKSSSQPTEQPETSGTAAQSKPPEEVDNETSTSSDKKDVPGKSTEHEHDEKTYAEVAAAAAEKSENTEATESTTEHESTQEEIGENATTKAERKVTDTSKDIEKSAGGTASSNTPDKSTGSASSDCTFKAPETATARSNPEDDEPSTSAKDSSNAQETSSANDTTSSKDTPSTENNTSEKDSASKGDTKSAKDITDTNDTTGTEDTTNSAEPPTTSSATNDNESKHLHDLELVSREKAEKFVNLEDDDGDVEGSKSSSKTEDPTPKREKDLSPSSETVKDTTPKKDVEASSPSSTEQERKSAASSSSAAEKAEPKASSSDGETTKKDTASSSTKEGTDVQKIHPAAIGTPAEPKADKFGESDATSNQKTSVPSGEQSIVPESTEAKSTEANATETKAPNTESKTTEPQGTEFEITETKGTETKGAETKGAETKATESESSEPKTTAPDPDSSSQSRGDTGKINWPTHKSTSEETNTDSKASGEDGEVKKGGDDEAKHLHELELVSRDKAEKFVNLENDDGDV